MGTQNTYTSGMLKRSHLRHLLDSTFGLTLATASWSALGKFIDDMSMNLNPTTSTIKNILDETEVIDEGYEPSMEAGTIYLDPSDSLYPKIKSIMMERQMGDDCRTYIMEILIDKTTSPYDAWVEECIVKVQSYGGGQGGVNAPITITPCGNRIKGTAAYADGVWTFTAAANG